MCIFLINRHTSATQDIQLDIQSFSISNEPSLLYTLSKLPSTETFVSHADNALVTKQVDRSGSHISIQLEPLSVNALVLLSPPASTDENISAQTAFNVFPNPSSGMLSIDFNLESSSQTTIELYNAKGQKVTTFSTSFSYAGKTHIEANLAEYPAGFYWISVRSDHFNEARKFILSK